MRDLVLEDDEDIELLEHVKDRKKRLVQQGMTNSTGTETGHSVNHIGPHRQVGQAIDKNDIPDASSVHLSKFRCQVGAEHQCSFLKGWPAYQS
ncbi:hypothetical protein HU200_007000 [Digitaria exilis]|uniref:Uncharacterized protein n=1 Tax=Digitaria exilis TaxID=1010633 RepID=A0A835FN53_9POAL|nr:hypothetical protein HU200_007000 [Digitaria exilis]